MLSFLHTDDYEDLAVGLADPAHDVPAILYGPAWREAISFDDDFGVFRKARGFPKPVRLARYLEPLLSGRVAHDGRPRGNDSARSAGWWARSEASEPWAPVSLGQVVTALSEVADALLVEAQRLARESNATVLAIRAEEPPLRHHRTRLQQAEEEQIRRGAVKASASSLSGLLAGGPSRFGETARVLREDPDRFGLPSTALVEHVGAWFAQTARAEGWGSGPRGRVKSSDVWLAYRDTPRALPQPDFFRLLEDSIGPRIRDREYAVPSWIHDEATTTTDPHEERKSA
ncbi:hypothetical protein GCM10011519_33740 [Marmoricola endophyticus]|uniref:Uncharacterized protein n=1 Tax=Marmoricola endophyticus TaxID=2040280 RepID=A0A917BW83_9ACTN|nr:hypothetical protein [Marmoricola endophyticus]GGF57030.1 hypothetical protein GCM10011519_33740 [Marmoricola endophyticus]